MRNVSVTAGGGITGPLPLVIGPNVSCSLCGLSGDYFLDGPGADACACDPSSSSSSSSGSDDITATALGDGDIEGGGPGWGSKTSRWGWAGEPGSDNPATHLLVMRVDVICRGDAFDVGTEPCASVGDVKAAVKGWLGGAGEGWTMAVVPTKPDPLFEDFVEYDEEVVDEEGALELPPGCDVNETKVAYLSTLSPGAADRLLTLLQDTEGTTEGLLENLQPLAPAACAVVPQVIDFIFYILYFIFFVIF
jgi:hypothetical protein